MNIDESAPMSTAEDVRRIVASFPEADEELVEELPTFSVAGKRFARLREDETVLACRVPTTDDCEFLLAADSRKYFSSPVYEGRPIILVRLAHTDPEELAELLTVAWETRAPERLRPLSPR